MQFEILRNSQSKNYRVSKFIPATSPLCSYCENSVEKISHLYCSCTRVHHFWIEATNWLALNTVHIPMDMETVIFGQLKEKSDSILNILVPWIKKMHLDQ